MSRQMLGKFKSALGQEITVHMPTMGECEKYFDAMGPFTLAAVACDMTVDDFKLLGIVDGCKVLDILRAHAGSSVSPFMQTGNPNDKKH